MDEQNISPEPTPEDAARAKRLANLRPRPPWKPGESGNPTGRPRGARNRSTIVKEALESAAFDNGADGTIADQLVWKQILKADDGDTTAFRELMDSGYGKIKETVEIIPPDITKKEIDEMTDEEAAAEYERNSKA